MPGKQETEAPMKSRVFTMFSLLALLVAMSAASVASAQEVTPGGDVYVKDFVQGDGGTDVEEPADACAVNGSNDADGNGVADNCEKPASGVNDVCVEGGGGGGADGVSANGEDCSPAAAVAADCASGADTDPVTGQPCNQEATVSSGDLPFTGFEAGIVALAGAALLGAGFAMRRFSRNGGTAI